MQILSARLVALLVIASFILLSSGSPLPEQNAVLPNDPAPLEAEDDPARVRRYQGYGLQQTTVQRAQPISNVHPDAAPFVDSPGTAQIAANSDGTAQAIAGAGTTPLQQGGMRKTHQAEVPLISEEANNQRGGMYGVPLSDGTPSQVGTVHTPQVGQDVSDSRVVGQGVPVMATSGVTPQVQPDHGSLAPPGLTAPSLGAPVGVNPSSRSLAEGQEVVDSAAAGSDVGITPGMPSSTLGASAEAGNVAGLAAMRGAPLQSERQGGQSPYPPAGSMSGMGLAAGKPVYGGNEAPSMPLVARVDKNGIGSVGERNTVPGAAESTAKGLYGQQRTQPKYAGRY